MKIGILNENNIIENVIIAENIELAETLTNKKCIILSNKHYGQVGWSSDGKYAIGPKPYDSWTWSEEFGYWVAPIETPNNTDAWIWNESLGIWEETDFPSKPYPSWIWENRLFSWYPPVDYIEDGNFYNWNESTLSWDLAE